MAESRHLLIFWEMLCFISGKSFLFQKIVVLTEGKVCPWVLTYVISVSAAALITYILCFISR